MSLVAADKGKRRARDAACITGLRTLSRAIPREEVSFREEHEDAIGLLNVHLKIGNVIKIVNICAHEDREPMDITLCGLEDRESEGQDR